MRKSLKKQKQIKLRNKKLVKKYPWLLPRYAWSDKPVDDYDYSYTELDSLPTGWRIAFGKFLVEDIDKVLRKAGYTRRYRIVQLKEKYGFMRLYSNGIPSSIYEEDHRMIEAYSAISEHICICCGAVDVYMTDSGWLEPLCKRCYEKHINCKLPYEDVIDPEDDPRMPDSYTIRRSSDGETTYDISDITTKVRMKYERSRRRIRDT